MPIDAALLIGEETNGAYVGGSVPPPGYDIVPIAIAFFTISRHSSAVNVPPINPVLIKIYKSKLSRFYAITGLALMLTTDIVDVAIPCFGLSERNVVTLYVNDHRCLGFGF